MRGRKPKVWDIEGATAAYASGASLREVAALYGVCLSTAHRALRGVTVDKSAAALKYWRARRRSAPRVTS